MSSSCIAKVKNMIYIGTGYCRMMRASRGNEEKQREYKTGGGIESVIT